MKPTGNLVADTICRTAEIGLAITGAADAGPLTIIEATPVAVIGVCPDCGQSGKLRDHITRRLVDLPVVGFPTRLHVIVPRFLCTAASCKRRIFQALLACADDGAKLTHRVIRWILQRLAIDRMSVSATAKALGVGWDLVNHSSSWLGIKPSDTSSAFSGQKSNCHRISRRERYEPDSRLWTTVDNERHPSARNPNSTLL